LAAGIPEQFVSREPIPTWSFALVVVRRGDRFLLAQEKKYGQSWSIPGGRVEPGETFVAAALREVKEETGVPVKLDGILRIEHAPESGSARMRVLFIASPLDDTPPKSVPDEESLGAAWLTLDEVRTRPLRGDELADLLQSVVEGRPVYPLTVLADAELSL
jgi:ADP-ribose pyrophosphatase YjhB (NUDIX family)